MGIWEIVLSTAFFLLAWLSFKAGIDLWHLKERGRHLASFSMPLFLLVGGLATADGHKWENALGSAICVLSVVFFVYQQLLSTRQKFEAPLTKPS